MKAKIMIAVLLCLLVLPIAFAAFPGNWWGKVYIKGEKVPDGTTINAYIGNKLVATTNVGDSLGSGYYELFIEGNAGDTIIFKIGSVEAGTAVFSDGAHPQLDLSLTKPACGDTICNGDETCSTCPGDCGACPPSSASESSGGGVGGGGGGGGGGSGGGGGILTLPPTNITPTEEAEAHEEGIQVEGEAEPVEEEEPPAPTGLATITGAVIKAMTGGIGQGILIIALIALVGVVLYLFLVGRRRKKKEFL